MTFGQFIYSHRCNQNAALIAIWLLIFIVFIFAFIVDVAIRCTTRLVARQTRDKLHFGPNAELIFILVTTPLPIFEIHFISARSRNQNFWLIHTKDEWRFKWYFHPLKRKFIHKTRKLDLIIFQFENKVYNVKFSSK